MSLSILVLGAPFDTQSSRTALKFVEAAIRSGQTIKRVFFYQDAIHTGSSLATPPQDEFDTYTEWLALQQKHKLDCVICIAAAARRGMINAPEAERHEKAASNLAVGFELSGLGQLVEAIATSDRLITFGN